jgi:hypothetical protein
VRNGIKALQEYLISLDGMPEKPAPLVAFKLRINFSTIFLSGSAY